MSQCRTPADEDEFDILVGYCDAFRDEGNRINGLIDRLR